MLSMNPKYIFTHFNQMMPVCILLISNVQLSYFQLIGSLKIFFLHPYIPWNKLLHRASNMNSGHQGIKKSWLAQDSLRHSSIITAPFLFLRHCCQHQKNHHHQVVPTLQCQPSQLLFHSYITPHSNGNCTSLRIRSLDLGLIS